MELVQALVTYFTVLVNVLILAFPIAFGGYFFVFAERVNPDILRYRKRVWRMGYSEFEVRAGEVIVRVLGAGILIFGLIVASQALLGGR